MPASPHPVFEPPKNLNVGLWRYMGLAKFVCLLESQSIYFSRADCLGDPFEGSLPRLNWRAEHSWPKELGEISEHDQARFAKFHTRNNQALRKTVYINCWHMNECESAAMWRLYALTNEAIAIKTSFQRLSDVLDEKTYVGVVEYIDFDRERIDHGNFLWRYLRKRQSFAHEREIRAITLHVAPTAHIDWFDSNPPGVQRNVILEQMIESVHVAPTAPKWFGEMIERLCRRFGLRCPVLQSSLDASPLF